MPVYADPFWTGLRGCIENLVLTYDDLIAQQSPKVYFKLDEAAGPGFVDSSGNGNHGTLEGTSPALLFQRPPLLDGSSYAVEWPSGGNNGRIVTSYTPVSADPFTHIFWFTPTGNPGGNVVLSTNPNGSSSTGYFLSISNPSAGVFRYILDGGGLAQWNVPTTLGVTYFVVVHATSTTATLYIDGGSQGGQSWVPPASGSRLVVLGRGVGISSHVPGVFDNYTFLDHADITPSEIQNLFTAGSGV